MIRFDIPKRHTLLCILTVIISIALTCCFHIRPLGIIILCFFGYWFYKTRSNLRIVPPPELQTKLSQFSERIRVWQQQNPIMFKRIIAGCLAVIAVLGHFVSGSFVVLMFLLVGVVVAVKYDFKLVRLEPIEYDWSAQFLAEPEPDDEFMPEVNESNLFVLERASDLATLSYPTEENEDEKSDEIPSELLIPDCIPEIEESSTDDDELAPADSNVSQSKVAKKEDIEFKKGHFKRDSSLSTTSSSSEESLSKGLKFPDHTTVDAPTRLRQIKAPTLPSQIQETNETIDPTAALLGRGQQILPNLLSGIIQWSMGAPAGTAPAEIQHRVVTALDSSDESDFEILENEDFK